MDLEVLVDDASDGSQRSFRFGRSPIRVGRSPLNDLPLPWPFVSHCHAVIQFDESGVCYVDLGSTNGTLVQGSRVPHNTPIAIRADTSIQICALTLRLRAAESTTPARMTYSDLGDGAALPQVASRPPLARTNDRTEESVARIAAAYDAYRASFHHLLETLTKESEGRHGAVRDALASAILARCPELPQEAAFRRWLGTDTPSATPDSLSTELARRLGVASLGSGPVLAERLSSLLLRFASAFVELRRGHEQFVASMGLGLVNDRSPLTTANDGSSVLAYLLDSLGDASRLDELNRSYADLMLHQMAMVGASTAGARDVLDAFRPEALATTRGGFAFFDALFGASRRLRAIERRLEDLSEERALTAALFGRGFARSYAVLLGRGGANVGAPVSPPTRTAPNAYEGPR